MVAKEIIDSKRQGAELAESDIRAFIAGFVSGEIPDYQMSALAMAICCRGMTAGETAVLTDAMMRSGSMLEWGEGLPVADKHSTGGVGDKLSLVIQPLAAACGLRVPSLTGRGLGITGGTADKLETIPGYNASLSLARFREIVAAVGVSMTVQTGEICPADKKLYALRDVTGTVASIPLITSSILSKKLAEGAGTLVFDVKCGKGAFMRTFDDAEALARSLVDSSRAAGRKALALVTRMDAPLGRAVGNANEVAEALAMLRGEWDWALEPLPLCVELAARMVALAKEIAVDEARELAWAKLKSGEAARFFEDMVMAQGGDLEAFAAHRAGAKTHRFRICAPRSGYIEGIDALTAGQVALALGAGRKTAGERIDPYAGIDLEVAVGDHVLTGAPLATLVTATLPDSLEQEAAKLLAAFSFSREKPDTKPLIMEEVA
ncbi:MAG: thymidine phosphorylase [Kiritimatiellae bacterium]|nr:thymidine phosphorylase [Kiritimatiellia bacterium]